ncbi:baseplate J/gp47 family protein [Roseibium polysiphoniae]|uniref:baseplate J/gp47 family protein n=1 Tax=Roseibium polysiphoniae TaxID=2571221 RepID=UPI003297C8DA
MIDLSQLPDPEVIETLDYETIVSDLKSDLKIRLQALDINWDVDGLETDPAVILLETAAYRELLLRNRINVVAQDQILAFASGNGLDHLGSFYGLSRIQDEDDTRFQERVQLAIVGRSPGGTEDRFRGICLGASLAVRDVAIWTEGRDPTIHVGVLSTDIGGAADAALLATVTEALEASSVRLVSDRYEVKSAVRKTVDVTLEIRISPTASSSLLDEMPDHVVAARESENLLGLDLTRAWLSKTTMVSGVTNVTVVFPAADEVAGSNEAIAIGSVTIQDGGRGR